MRQSSMSLSLAVVAALLALAADSAGMVVAGRGLAEIYVDVSGERGIRSGQRLRLGAPDAAVGELEVLRVQNGVAVCRVVCQRRTIVKGDAVSLLNPLSVAAPQPAASPTPPSLWPRLCHPPPSPRRARRRRVRSMQERAYQCLTRRHLPMRPRVPARSSRLCGRQGSSPHLRRP